MIKATAGEDVRLSVEIINVDSATVTWKKEDEKDNQIIRESDRYRFEQVAAFLYLEIVRCRQSDSGLYRCYVEHDTGSCWTEISLFITGGSGSTWARVVGPTKIEIDWECSSVDSYNIEGRTAPFQTWVLMATDVKHPPMTLELPPGASYSFRIVGKNGNVTSSSAEITLTGFEDNLNWETEQFIGRYLELDELGKGRFATVRRARDKGTGQEVALKQTPRHKQPRSLTRAEYDLLASSHHGNIIRAFALFENAPRPGFDTIVLELVRGPTLFVYLSKKSDYTEGMAIKYTSQLLSALQWLHRRNTAHLDLKPENVLVDQDSGIVKLIDLGEAVRGPVDEVVPPADLEFAAPELVLGKPTGTCTDMWAAGVFIYVLLSGVSPFLDDSVEETTANILKCDFCFPNEYFESISNDAKDLLGRLLCLHGEERATAEATLTSPWFKTPASSAISSIRLAEFTERRAHCSKSRQDRNDRFYS